MNGNEGRTGTELEKGAMEYVCEIHSREFIIESNICMLFTISFEWLEGGH
jgi:hypothetical protein